MIFTCISYILFVIGIYKMIRKLGKKGWQAFIPIYNLYALSSLVDKAEDGLIFSFTNFAGTICAGYLGYIFEIEKNPNTVTIGVFVIIGLVISLFNLIYAIKISSGICETFGAKKSWVVAYVLIFRIMIFIWGISDRRMPIVLASDEVDESKVAALSEVDVNELDNGLTINIKDRTVRNGVVSKTLLRDIHLNIEPGHMVLLLGGSGAGKTTFVNAITGYEQADATIKLNGEDVYTEFDKMKYEIGFVPQQDLIRYNDTVIRTLSDAASLRLPANVRFKERRARIKEVLDIFGLTPVKHSIVGKQSGGQKKRISIASEFISNPFLFILDEPDSGLDGIMAKDLMERLHDISRQGKIVIVITHTPDRVIEYFDDVIVLGKDEKRTGRLVYYGTVTNAREFFNCETMEDIVRIVNRVEEGGEGKADELIEKYAEVCHE